MNETSDLEEFGAIAARERDCGHDPHRVDFVRSRVQDTCLGACKSHKECAIGIARNAEIRGLRKSKAMGRELARQVAARWKAQKAKRGEPAGKPLDSLYMEDDSESGVINPIAHSTRLEWSWFVDSPDR